MSISLSPSRYPESDAFYVQRDGSLHFPSGTVSMLPLGMYCVDNFVNEEGEDELAAVVCIDGEDLDEPVEHVYVSGE